MGIVVTVRGREVDVGAIVAAVRKHPAVRQAVIVADPVSSASVPLVAYVVPKFDQRTDPQGPEAAIDAAHTAKWRKLSELSYSNLRPATPTRVPDAGSANADFNLAGWKSSYTGRPVPDAEMIEWVNETVRAILRFRPKRVLEIGCGTGLLLFRIAPFCEEYRATDLSQRVVDYVDSQIAANPAVAHAKVTRTEACDFSDLPEGHFDLVIVNSVIQYFPGSAYLIDVIAKATRALRADGTVFLGDLKNLDLLEAFGLSVLLEQARDDDTINELRARLRRRIDADPELTVSPALFPALISIIPQIRDVIVEPRRGRTQNEMTRFRFNAILRTAPLKPPVGEIPFHPWTEGRWTLDALRKTLETERPAMLAFADIPDARTANAIAALAALRSAGEDTTVQQFRKSLPTTAAVDPQALWDLEETFPYDVEIAWPDPVASASRSFHALFRRRDVELVPTALSAVPSVEPIAWQRLATDPVRRKRIDVLTSELDQLLRSELPGDLVPSQIVVVDEIPASANA